MIKKFIKIILMCAGLLTIGGVAGYFLGAGYESNILNKKLDVIKPIREHNSSYKFIDPLLAYILPSADQQSEMASLKNKIRDIINNDEKSNNLSDASVFFYDLDRGRWVGINENDKYSPASMLKVVMMVSYFKKAENDSSLLNSKLFYDKKTADLVGTNIVNVPSSLIVGKSYAIEDLISEMVVDSDNGATALLSANADQASLDSIYNVLNIENPKTTDNFTISPRAYSLFFRILYSATYLDKKMSEKALDILSKTSFNAGLVAGVPKNIVVSHKFGEHVDLQDQQISRIELHDCGIVYYPASPYFVCVMTGGNNLNSLQNTIKNVSQAIYQNYSASK
ncbi:MAG: class A beta-lactamase-related serine hydrolase [Candidatus Staskawiczbacteria bacterium]|nr:class A beta-lactamase-related serine hydrolase [Candidatus Staskawiczbacteria bacterium]